VSELSLNDAQTRVLGVIVDNDDWVTHETFKHLGLNKSYITNVVHSLKKAGMLPSDFRVHRGHKIGERLPEFIECIEQGLYVQDFAPRFNMKVSEARKLFKRLKVSDHPRCRDLKLVEDQKRIIKPRPKAKAKPKPEVKIVSNEPTRDERLVKLIKFIEKKDFWVTSIQCSNVYGCKLVSLGKVIKRLKLDRRLPPGFNVIPLRTKSPLSKNLRKINRLVALEMRAIPFEKMAEELGISVEDVKSIRGSLLRLRHPKYLKAVTVGRQLKREQARARKVKPNQFLVIDKRFSNELMREIGMDLAELNAYNAVNLYSEKLMYLLGNFVGRQRDMNFEGGDSDYLKRYGLIEFTSRYGPPRLVVTKRAMGLLFLQGYVHPSPLKPYKISDEEQDPVPVTVSPESES